GGSILGENTGSVLSENQHSKLTKRKVRLESFLNVSRWATIGRIRAISGMVRKRASFSMEEMANALIARLL
ncbi:hypothetical protein, partial [Roseibium sediminis]|uniref:hypothetical protein n=1 Tax=Roseibium sediminis TaxID=1775174 RepID=UPI00195650BE